MSVSALISSSRHHDWYVAQVLPSSSQRGKTFPDAKFRPGLLTWLLRQIKRNPRLLVVTQHSLLMMTFAIVRMVASANGAFWVWAAAGWWGTLTRQQPRERTKQFIRHKIIKSFPLNLFHLILSNKDPENGLMMRFLGRLLVGYPWCLKTMASLNLHSSLSVFCLQSCWASSGNGLFAFQSWYLWYHCS